MPSRSVAQRRYMAMLEHGKLPNRTGMSRSQLHDFASTPESGLPSHVAKHSPLRRKRKS